jgi:hypothetical protein
MRTFRSRELRAVSCSLRLHAYLRVSVEGEASVVVHVVCLIGGAQVIGISLQKHINALASVIEHCLWADRVTTNSIWSCSHPMWPWGICGLHSVE